MKLPKQQVFVMIIGFFLLSLLLQRIVKPITFQLSSPYAFLNPVYATQYPFTAVVVIIRAISMALTPLFLLSFIPGKYFFKLVTLICICVLSQLLSIQEIISDTTIIPLEWALSLSIAGALLIPPIILYFLKGFYHSAKSKFHHPKAPIKYI